MKTTICIGSHELAGQRFTHGEEIPSSVLDGELRLVAGSQVGGRIRQHLASQPLSAFASLFRFLRNRAPEQPRTSSLRSHVNQSHAQDSLPMRR